MGASGRADDRPAATERTMQQLRVPFGLQVQGRLRDEVMSRGVRPVRQGLLLQEDWLALVGVAPPRAGYLLLPPCMLLSRLRDSGRRGPSGGQEKEEEKVEESPRRF